MIAFGNSTISQLFVGNNAVDKIYFGNDLIYTAQQPARTTWTAKTWNGFTNLDGRCIWTDGTHIYYSSGSSQYELDKATSTWTAKTWSGLTSFVGDKIWTDGTNIYFSNAKSYQYVLDKSTSTWTAKTWNGFTNLNGSCIWTDGTHIYYGTGASSVQYELDKSTSTWTAKTWSGVGYINGLKVQQYDYQGSKALFFDNVASSSGTKNRYDIQVRKLNADASGWTAVGSQYYLSVSSSASPAESHFVADGILYLGKTSYQLKFDNNSGELQPMTWNGYTSINGQYVWKIEEHIYYSNANTQYELV